METLAQSLKILADPTRLRILRLLGREALSVGEIATILGVAQPSVSKQLAALRRAGLVGEKREGVFSFYRLQETGDSLWTAVSGQVACQDDGDGDLSRLTEVLRRRVDRGSRPAEVLEPGRSWPAWARALGHLLPPLRVADLGCGDGALTAEIARWARSVVAVDRDAQRLARARQRLRRQGHRRVRFLCEDFTALSLPDESFDVAVLSQVLHACPEPDAALGQARRILLPGGRLLVLDLAPHRETWVREKLGHLHLGFRSEEMAARLRAAGFVRVRNEDLPRAPGGPFRVVVFTAVRGRGARKT